MLNEADLNRIKGLIHYLNSGGRPPKPATRGSGLPARDETAANAAARRIQLAPQESGAESDLTFDVEIIDSNGDTQGMVKYDNAVKGYAFFPGAGVRA